jgi:putative membrane protein
MRRIIIGCTLLAFGALSVQFSSATAASAAANSADRTFATKNEQVNLAEQALGQLALQRGSSAAVKELATKTIADHKSAQGKLESVAKALSITLPTAPNAMQQSQAAQLKAAPAGSFDSMYLQIQLAGHQLSIADTQTELNSGADQSMISYAQGYLPVAQMHLSMTQQDLAAAGLPTGAPAGTGGQAATGQHDHLMTAGLLGGGAVLLFAAGLFVYRRPARTH